MVTDPVPCSPSAAINKCPLYSAVHSALTPGNRFVAALAAWRGEITGAAVIRAPTYRGSMWDQERLEMQSRRNMDESQEANLCFKKIIKTSDGRRLRI